MNITILIFNPDKDKLLALFPDYHGFNHNMANPDYVAIQPGKFGILHFWHFNDCYENKEGIIKAYKDLGVPHLVFEGEIA
jgi:hypothetical protein